MNRALGSQEQEKVRTARANFFNTTRQQGPASSLQPESTNSTLASNSQPEVNSRDHRESDTRPINNKPNKLFKMSSSTSPKGSKGDAASKSQIIIRFYDPEIGAKDALGRTQDDILHWSDAKLESSHNYIQMLFPLPEGSPFNGEAPVINLEVMQAFRTRSELRQQLRLSFERMLKFYGFQVSDKSELELEKEKDEEEAAKLKAVASEAADPLLESAFEAARQKTVDTGHRTAATQGDAEYPKTDTYTDAPIDADFSSKDPEQNVTYHIIRAPNWRQQFKNWAVSFDHNHLRITRILRCLRVLGLQTEYNAFFTALERVFNDPGIKISGRTMEYWKLAVTRSLHLAPDGNNCKWLEGWEKEQDNLKRANEEQLRNERDGIQKKKSVRFNKDVQEPEAE